MVTEGLKLEGHWKLQLACVELYILSTSITACLQSGSPSTTVHGLIVCLQSGPPVSPLCHCAQPDCLWLPSWIQRLSAHVHTTEVGVYHLGYRDSVHMHIRQKWAATILDTETQCTCTYY